MNPQEHNKEPHPYFRKDRGVTVQFGNRCKFLKPGDTYTDPRGRKYRVAEDGSLRRVKK